MVLRADAQRNLERVLLAATDVFTERGPDASVDEIARRAGVGHATVFRRFPTKESLMSAVAGRWVADVQALADEALAADEPGESFFHFVWRVAELHVAARGLHDCMVRCEEVPGAPELTDAVTRIVQRAQKAGAVRKDVTPDAVQSLVRGALSSAPDGEWRCYVAVVLDGLRTRG